MSLAFVRTLFREELSLLIELNNIRIYLYPKDHNPPHVHCYKGEYSAVIDIRTGIVIAGNMKLADLKIVKDWVKDNRLYLNQLWESYQV